MWCIVSKQNKFVSRKLLSSSKFTLIFDLDGTLIDSFDQIAKTSNRVRRELGEIEIPEDEIKLRIGLPVESLFFDFSSDRLPKVVEMFREFLHEEVTRGNTAFKGSVDLLFELKQHSYGVAVATSKPHTLACKVVANSELNKLVDFVQGVNGFLPKPDPEVIVRCQARLRAQNYIMVGDRPEDVLAGIKARCYTVGIAQGAFDEMELRAFGAHESFGSIKALHEDLFGVLNRAQDHNRVTGSDV